MRLTADLINSSLSYLNPLKERELDLRGHKIPALENLGLASTHESLDLTDNDIPSLANLPLCPRLSTLLLARNRITHISPTLHASAPALSTLVLTGNRIAELGDLDALGRLPRLTHLALLDNPVCKKEWYRAYVIWRCPSVRFLDYARVTEIQRAEASHAFGTWAEPTALVGKIAKAKTGAPVAGVSVARNGEVQGEKAIRIKLTEEERKRVERLALRARTEEEIGRLELLLEQGKVPGEDLFEGA